MLLVKIIIKTVILLSTIVLVVTQTFIGQKGLVIVVLYVHRVPMKRLIVQQRLIVPVLLKNALVTMVTVLQEHRVLQTVP